MAYKLGMSGKAVDELLQKANAASNSTNGWEKLTSSESSPVDLNSLVRQGCFAISFWKNGPNQLITSGPINVYNSKDTSNNTVYQIVYDAGKIYSRTTTGSTFSSGWSEVQNNSAINMSASTPSNPKDNTIWIDTSSSTPLFKIYKVSSSGTGTWVTVTAPDLAARSVYDPQGIKKNINTYLNNAIASADLENEKAVYDAHLIEGESSGAPIHVTTAEKSKWAAGVSTTDANTTITTFENNMQSYADGKLSTASTNVNTASTNVTNLKKSIDSHIADSTIHVTASQASTWDSKAAGDHTHKNNGTVTISASNIIGLIPIERIDPAFLERNVTVTSYSNMLALTKSDVQNGDSVFVNDSNPTAYFVVDDTKLGTANAFVQYAAPASTLTWANITGKPTTLSGYGITTCYTKTQINSLYNTLTTKINTLKTNVSAATGGSSVTVPTTLDSTITNNIRLATELSKQVDLLIKNMGITDFATTIQAMITNVEILASTASEPSDDSGIVDHTGQY